MAALVKLLEKRGDQMDDQLAETLLSFTDFLLFKQLILEYKANASKKSLDVLEISVKKAQMHNEDQSDGEEMPDLMLDIKPFKGKK